LDAANKVYRKTSFSLLWERIHYTRRELDAISRELFKLNLLLAHTLSAEDWDLIDIVFEEWCLLGCYAVWLL
jgi:hypothetical protein